MCACVTVISANTYCILMSLVVCRSLVCDDDVVAGVYVSHLTCMITFKTSQTFNNFIAHASRYLITFIAGSTVAKLGMSYIKGGSPLPDHSCI